MCSECKTLREVELENAYAKGFAQGVVVTQKKMFKEVVEMIKSSHNSAEENTARAISEGVRLEEKAMLSEIPGEMEKHPRGPKQDNYHMKKV